MINKQNMNLVQQNFTSNPKSFEQWTGGPYWRSPLKLNQFIDVVMHLLFLGVAKSAKEIIMQWIGDSKRMAVYKQLAFGIFFEVSEMSLEWCKLLVSSSGWVSDNYVAFSRVIKWFYYPITFLEYGNELQKDGLDVERWDGVKCRNWLAENHCDTNGNLKILKERIRNQIDTMALKPRIDDRSKLLEKQINQFIGSLLSMISCVMAKYVTEVKISRVEREVKVFLSYLNLLESSIQCHNDSGKRKQKKKFGCQDITICPC